ncbi:MAG TPA: hypothetical protein VE377_03270 [Candidatus Dormibacteraeota bacterium]|nr:hypothetical protein [Candidatus Dormibacteraeota bacterium]
MPISPRSDGLPTRIAAGVLLFVLCCLLSSFWMVHDAPNPLHLGDDDVAARSDQRFTVMKSVLPSHGVVGYIGEPGNSGTADYYLAQYSLAPLVVDRSLNHPLVIANFPTSSASSLPQKLQLVRDFGNGVLLYASKDMK